MSKYSQFLIKFRKRLRYYLLNFHFLKTRPAMRLTIKLSLLLLCGMFIYSCIKPSTKEVQSDYRKLEILFLGHNSQHHNSAAYAPILTAALSKEGMNFTYTEDVNDLNAENLDKYDGLIIYANHEKITPEQEKALIDFVEKGRGFIPIHSASFCFQNSPKYIALVGGQFQTHKTDTFTAVIVKRDHVIVNKLKEFSTWDETYVHTKLSPANTVLMERIEGDHHEPWTWVREQGNGRVFYTAYGHDERTWNNPGFQQLMKEGILWAVGDDAKKKWSKYKSQMPTLVYRDEPNIPNYEKRNPAPQYQEPLSAEESAKLIQVPVGFDLKLFASEPDIINPIAMDWDERGRLWIIETVDYPNTVLDDDNIGDDRIKICEDTDGDGKADKFTVFAEKLNIATSIAFANGGIIVSQAPHFLFLKDTDGDDKADVRKIIIDGWGVTDTHAGPSNLKYGYDNQIWGVVGYSGFNGTIAGANRIFRQAVYRFKPDASSFELMTNTSNNTWGLGFTENNDVFASTANNTHSVFFGIPDKGVKGVEGIPQLNGSAKIDGHYAFHPSTDKVRQVDVFGGFTAAAGHNFYTARNYPKEFWNQVAFVCEPTGHLVHMARIEKKGAGFVEKDGWNLFSSADEWVSPVEAKTGPDGNVWVLDWYDFIIQHNPTPTLQRGGYPATNGKGNAYENPLRDKSHGRIWRVVNRTNVEQPIKLSKAEPDKLIEQLNNANLFWRMTAQRLLVERSNTDVLPKLYELAKDTRLNEFGYTYSAVHALWTIDGLVDISKDDNAKAVITAALKHPSAGMRKAAIQILSKRGLTEETLMQSNVLNDTDANTRLAAINSLIEIPVSESMGKTLYTLSLDEGVKNDEWLSKAVYVAAARHKKGFIDAFLAANPDYLKNKANKKSREDVTLDDTAWKAMELPQYIETAGLAIDGVIWFRKVIDVPASAAGKSGKISLGPIDDSDVTWINGVKVGTTERRSSERRNYDVPANVLIAGKNIVAIRVIDNNGNGGMAGKPEDMFLEADGKSISLAGPWKYEVEKEYVVGQSVFKGTSIGELFADTYVSKPVPAVIPPASSAGAIVIKLNVIKNEMKYDLKSFTVEAGKQVEIVFENPDFMQHNLVIIQPGSLQILGKAADKLAADPQGSEKQYVPSISEVLFSTKLVNPQETVKLIFTAPKQVGDYPFVCTFPGHWAIMNGIMKVVAPKK
jgi:putative membrane-bound dehydrogenase-like protein